MAAAPKNASGHAGVARPQGCLGDTTLTSDVSVPQKGWRKRFRPSGIHSEALRVKVWYVKVGIYVPFLTSPMNNSSRRPVFLCLAAQPQTLELK